MPNSTVRATAVATVHAALRRFPCLCPSVLPAYLGAIAGCPAPAAAAAALSATDAAAAAAADAAISDYYGTALREASTREAPGPASAAGKAAAAGEERAAGGGGAGGSAAAQESVNDGRVAGACTCLSGSIEMMRHVFREPAAWRALLRAALASRVHGSAACEDALSGLLMQVRRYARCAAKGDTALGRPWSAARWNTGGGASSHREERLHALPSLRHTARGRARPPRWQAVPQRPPACLPFPFSPRNNPALRFNAAPRVLAQVAARFKVPPPLGDAPADAASVQLLADFRALGQPGGPLRSALRYCVATNVVVLMATPLGEGNAAAAAARHWAGLLVCDMLLLRHMGALGLSLQVRVRGQAGGGVQRAEAGAPGVFLLRAQGAWVGRMDDTNEPPRSTPTPCAPASSRGP
jgi:hypothetical protein